MIHYKKLKRKLYYNMQNFYFFKYHSCFLGSLIFRGKKIWAFNFFNRLKYQLKLKENIEPNVVFFLAMLKITPNVLLFPLKIGGKLEKVPMPISWKKKVIFATKWVIKLLKEKSKKITLDNVTDILISAIYNKGIGFQKKQSYNQIGFNNRYLIKRFK